MAVGVLVVEGLIVGSEGETEGDWMGEGDGSVVGPEEDRMLGGGTLERAERSEVSIEVDSLIDRKSVV